MDKNQEKQPGLFASIIGDPSPLKSAGLTFSAASLAPVLTALVFMLVLLVTGLATQEGVEHTDWYLYCNYLLLPITFAIVTGVILRWQKTSLKRAVAAQKCSPKYFLIAILMQFGLLSLAELNTLFLGFLALFGYESAPIELPSLDGFGLVGVLFVVAVLPAIFEEVIFRGLLVNGMRSLDTWKVVLISGGLFALYHQNPAQTVYQFCCGAAFAFVAVKAGSILPTVLSHFLNNAYIIIMTKLGVTAFPTPVYITMLVLETLSLIAAMVWLFLDKSTKTEPSKEEKQKTFWLFAAPGIFYCVVMWLSVFVTGMMG